ncbi:ATP-binding protein [Vitiosangium sp. GDMCC 1.1324]|uniref:sensor histidine kinase n=1 Tax=Vitiosangium sp. (strain GDMCC 1.1324) TaxID=2138576 RepID=UPI000D3803B1|nr:ATP-binding protein [Vitiosangium sp. GDMCC 1.1324]PTL75190.1 histidine kinase [Vitiosangium sp. GDMCC 1.1324]
MSDSHTEVQAHGALVTSSGEGSGVGAEKTLREIQQVLLCQRRLDALRRTALLDTPAEEAFDRLARLATRMINAPVGLVTLVDKDRQFFKSCVGLPPPWCDVRQTPLTHSFCMHVVATGEPLIIEDARLHPVLRENLAVDQLGVVAYAGMPLTTSEGEVIGTFCVLDTQPRVWTDDDLYVLNELATSVMTEIELRTRRALETQARAVEAARAEAEAARQRFALLAELSAVLAEGFDVRAMLARAARWVVPLVADGCMVELLERDGRLRRVAVVHRDAAEEARLRSLPESLALLEPEPKDASLVAGHVRLTGPEGACLRLPLTSHDRVLGVATFTTQPSRPLREVELSLAQEVARRMAMAIESARLYEEAHEAIQLRDRFLSIASHELRTPLTALRLQAQSLLRGMSQPVRPLAQGELTNKVRGISRQVERLGLLVDELLDISRLSEGHLSFHFEDVDLVDVVREVAARFREELAQAGNVLMMTGLDVSVVGRWNRLRLEQVVVNLLTNAIKYGRGRPISMEVRADVDRARLIVRDEGIGISPQDQARIFERFERAVSEQHYTGLGLGLWIVREIVRKLGGSISVNSMPGVGSAFLVELPLHPVPVSLLH